MPRCSPLSTTRPSNRKRGGENQPALGVRNQGSGIECVAPPTMGFVRVEILDVLPTRRYIAAGHGSPLMVPGIIEYAQAMTKNLGPINPGDGREKLCGRG